VLAWVFVVDANWVADVHQEVRQRDHRPAVTKGLETTMDNSTQAVMTAKTIKI
jgi:hypothetical protein